MVVNGGRRGPTDIDGAKRWAKPDQAGPRGSQNQAATRDIEQFPQMLDRIRLHRSLAQDFVATLELAEELIVQILRSVRKTSVGFSIAGSSTRRLRPLIH